MSNIVLPLLFVCFVVVCYIGCVYCLVKAFEKKKEDNHGT